MNDNSHFMRDYWVGDSRDGVLVNGEGYHYLKMDPGGRILEAFEVYETEDGDEVVSFMPELVNVNWLKDLGFEDMESLEAIQISEFERVRDQLRGAA